VRRVRLLRALRRTALTVLLALVVAVSVTVRGILDPPVAVDPGTGPVMVLGGDRSRLVFAQDLTAVASTDRPLVLSSSAGELWELDGRSCDEPHVTCVTPDPETTYGEALLAQRLAREEGWTRLTVVTSTFHVQRTRWQFGACVDAAPVTVLGAPSPGGELLTSWRVVRETLALARARVRYTCR
jgi:hypothetical protein